MDITSLARTALAFRSVAARQQQALAAVKQAHEADQAVVKMLAEAAAQAPRPTTRGRTLDIVV